MFLEAFPRRNHCCPVLHLAGHNTGLFHCSSPATQCLCCAVIQENSQQMHCPEVSLVRCAAKSTEPRDQSQRSPGQRQWSPLLPLLLSLLAPVTLLSQNIQAALQLCTVEIKPSLIPAAVRVELQCSTPCCAHHKLTQFEIYRNKDIPGTFPCHGLKLRGWPNPNILCVEKNDVFNLKPSQGPVTHGLCMAGSAAALIPQRCEEHMADSSPFPV